MTRLPADHAQLQAAPITAFDTFRTTSRRILSQAGMLRPAFNVWRTVRDLRPRVVVQNYRARRSEGAAGRSVPPGSLIYSVCGTRAVEHFLESGRWAAESLTGSLDRLGRPLEGFQAVLDMGCGCGRVLRQWRAVRGPSFYGTDYNAASIQWVRRHLGFVEATTNDLWPPMRYGEGAFDLVYAISVLTHLPAELQRPWMAEFRRILRPGGLLIVTLCGDGMMSRLTAAERDRFMRGELVVVDADYAGSNMCTAYHSDDYVHGEWSRGFRILEKTRHSRGVPYQDQWLLERTE